MAYFAELNSGNTVLQVIVVSNADVDAHGGDESAGAEAFVETIVPFSSGGVGWKQTSYNGSFRKQYAGIDYTYDSTKDKFISQKPYPSWSLDSNDDWQAPVTYPNVSEIGGLQVLISWDEANLRWLGVTYTDADPPVQTNYRWDASALEWIAL